MDRQRDLEGQARAAAGLAGEAVDSVWKEIAFEALLHHELRVYAAFAGCHAPTSASRLPITRSESKCRSAIARAAVRCSA